MENSDIIDIYKRIANENENISEELVREARTVSLKNLNILKNSRILDLGCGKGEMIGEVASRYKGYNLHFTGVDFSSHMLRKAKKKTKDVRKNGHRVSFVCKECTDYLKTCDKGKYDVVIASFLLSYVDSSKLFPLANKALKKGGKFIILSASDDHLRGIEKYFFRFVLRHPFLSSWGSISRIVFDQKISRTIPLKKTRELLYAEGFSKVKGRSKPILGSVWFDDPVVFIGWLHRSVWATRYSSVVKENKKEIFFKKAAEYLEKNNVKIVNVPIECGKSFKFFWPAHIIIAEK